MATTSAAPAIDAHAEEGFQDDAPLIVLDLVLWCQMSTFSAHELVHLGNNIENIVRDWISYNIRPLSAARREDDTADWYFPLLFQKSVQQRNGADDSGSSRSKTWSWSGVHHSSGEIHNLFALDHLPPEWIRNMKHPRDDIIACSGGQLLLTHRISSNFHEPVSREFQTSRHTRPGRHGRLCPMATTSQNWKPLLVTNPLTREWRVLPAPDCRDAGVTSWDCRDLRAFMVEDDEANSYQVILVFINCVCVYKSTCNSWTCRAFPEPWGFIRTVDSGPGYVSASSCVGGRLYFADLEVRGFVMPLFSRDIYIRSTGNLRVFELDIKTGTWKPPIRYPVRNFFQQNPDDDHGFRIGSYTFQMVECMGSMYAVIPAELGMLVSEEEIRRTYNGDDLHTFQLGFMPLGFHVLRLQGGAGLAQGILRIHIPYFANSESGVDGLRQARMHSLTKKLNGDRNRRILQNARRFRWFRCTARGSVIWVSWDDYLLQYDVVSGESNTRILPDTSFAGAPALSYKPSFHMKP